MTESSTLRNLRNLALAAITMPSAFGMLDKFEPRLGLSDLVKRIIHNYEVVLTAIWDWLKSVLPLPPDIDVQFWSFFALILTPALAEFLRHAVQGRQMVVGRPGFWGIASAFAFAGYCIAFSTGTEMIASGIEAAVFTVIFLTFMAVYVILVVMLGNYWTHFKPEEGVKPTLFQSERVQNTTLIVLFLFFLYLSLLVSRPADRLVYDLIGAERSGGVRGMAVMASLVLMALFAFGNLRTPAYVFFWLFGIVFIDFVATDVVPHVTLWLDQAICPNGECPPPD